MNGDHGKVTDQIKNSADKLESLSQDYFEEMEATEKRCTHFNWACDLARITNNKYQDLLILGSKISIRINNQSI